MAGENVIGKISQVDGGGELLIIRSSGEQIVAKPGDTLLSLIHISERTRTY